MSRRRYRAEEIIHKLREAEVVIAQGKSTAEVGNKLGVAEQTYCCWRREYGGLQVDQAEKLKELEKENARVKRPLAEAEFDNEILKEATSGNF